MFSVPVVLICFVAVVASFGLPFPSSFGKFAKSTQLFSSIYLSPPEEIVLSKLQKMCNIANYDFPANKTLILASNSALRTIFAAKTNSTVLKVPIDLRVYCRDFLLKSLCKNTDPRRPLLCNAGFSGCGKSVMQALNMWWFTQEIVAADENATAIAVEVTFNDDQSSLHPSTANEILQFKQAIAVRVLHRVVSFITNITHANSKFEDVDFAKSVKALESPLEYSLKILKKMVGAPDDVKVLLCVDELMKVATETFVPAAALKALTSVLDADEQQQLFLSVTAYGCVDLSRFLTGSNRALQLQPLPPIGLGMSPSDVCLLPPLLQYFADEEQRKLLPFDRKDSKDSKYYSTLYSRVSKLWLSTGGHPRCVNVFYEEMGKFKYEFDRNTFGKNLETFLDENEKNIRSKLSQLGFPRNFNGFNINNPVELGNRLESLARDTAVAFEFPSNPETAKYHNMLLKGTLIGHCLYLPDPVGGEGHAFISLPVLELWGSVKSPLLGPCGTALGALGVALVKHSNVAAPGEEGKSLEGVMKAALLLYTRCNPLFTLFSMCDKRCGDEAKMSVRLCGGDDVEMWENVTSFPVNDRKKRSVATALQPLLRKLREKPSHSGAVFQPTYDFNEGGDVFGLFKCADHVDSYVLLCIECKDWFFDMAGKDTIEDRWLKSKIEFPDEVVDVVLKDDQGKSVAAKVTCLNFLFASNEPGDNVKCGARDGVVSVQSMRNWLPTAAYACENAHQQRRLFGR